MRRGKRKDMAVQTMQYEYPLEVSLHAMIRRFFAACCVLAMCIGILPLGGGIAYADDTTNAQIVSAPAHNKIITANTDGTYTLRMSVTEKSTATQQQTVKPLDIAMVVDSSDPNSDAAQLHSTTALSALQTSAQTLLDQIAAKNSAIRKIDPSGNSDIRVTLVKAAGERNTAVGNDHYSDANNNAANYSQVIDGLTTDIDTVKRHVGALEAGGPNHIDYGLQLAKEQLASAQQNQSKTRANTQYATILYSPGNTQSWNTQDTSEANAAIAQAYALKHDIGSTVYAIDANANPSADTKNFMNYVSSDYPDAQSMSNPGQAAATTYASSTGNANNTDGLLNNLIATATTNTAYTDISMTDTLSQYALFVGCAGNHIATCHPYLEVTDANGTKLSEQNVGLANTDGTSLYQIEQNGDSGVITITFPENYALINGYTYTLVYGIEPTQQAFDEYAANINKGLSGNALYNDVTGDPGTGTTSAGKAGFRSNSSASLTYRLDTAGQTGQPVTVAMPHPVMQVEANELTVNKVWLGSATNRPQSITVHVSCTVGTGTPCQSGNVADMTITPDQQGNWSHVIALPLSSHARTYKVTEDAISGFQTFYEKRSWRIPKSRLANDHHTTTVTNYPTTGAINLGQITVGKTVANVDTSNDFSFMLTANSGQSITDTQGKSFTSTSTTIAGPYTQGQQKTGTFSGTVTIPLPAAADKQTPSYGFQVKEHNPNSSNAQAWQADTDAVGVTVAINRAANGLPLFNTDGTVQTTVTYTYANGDADKTDANANLAAFTNKLLPVTSLPLTGEGGPTARLCFVVAGGIAACMLIAAVSTALWRKRHIAHGVRMPHSRS